MNRGHRFLNQVRLIRQACFSIAIFSVALAAQSQGTPVPDPYTQTRATSFTYYGVADGVFNGMLKTETIEPGDAQVCVTTTYTYDTYGNKINAGTANCAGASGRAPFAARAASSVFTSQTVTVAGVPNVVIPAGAYAVTASNALNQSESRQFDPRFGAVVSLTGPNGLTTSWSVDNFGRKTMELRADGTRTLSAYCYISGRINGADLSSNSVTPGDPLSCPTPSAAEIPAEAVMFVHTEPHDNTAGVGAKNGPFARVYSDKAGRKIRSVTEAFDGASQPGGTNRLIVQDTDYNQYGAQIVATQPYFLDTCASTASAAGSCPSGNYGMTRTDYDAIGRVVAVFSADAATANNAGGSQPQASTTFGTRGNKQAAKTAILYQGLVTTTTNDKGQTRKEEKNADGKVVRITDALGAQIVHQHDAFGNLVRTKDALQNILIVEYDKRGRKVSMNDPDTGLWKYDYNALGELVWQQSPNQRAAALAAAQQTTMAYDKLGRMTSRVEPEYTSTWTYDKNVDGSFCMQGAVLTRGAGKLCESSTTNFLNRKVLYDSLGRPINTRTTITSGPSFASAVSYDATHGRPDSMTYPTGVKVNYNYTGKGFLSALKLAQAASITPLPATVGGTPGGTASLAANSTLWSAQAYNAWGRAEQSTYGNNVVNRAAFDALTGRTTSIQAGISTPDNIVNYSYKWDSINLLTQRNDANGDGTSGAVTDDLVYDALGRLSNYTVSAPAIPTLNRSVTLQYNALGMLLYKSDVGVYTYGAQNTAGVRPHALQSVTGASAASYTYDANGNLQTASAGSYRSVAYTSFNLPDSQNGAQGPSGSPKYTWQYDENHARVKETRVVAGVTRTTWSIHPDSQGGLGFECESAGTSTNCDSATTQRRHYLSVGGASIGVLVSTGAMPAPVGTAPPTVTTTIALVKVEYWHKDHLGSLVATTDHTGNLTAPRYSYDPFGKRRQAGGQYDAFGTLVVDWTTNTNNGTDRGYTGHEHLDDIGLIHMNGRMFDPRLGLMLQGDPFIQDPTNLQNYNRYGYCLNNPLTCTDPSGFSFWTSFRDAAIVAIAAVADAYGCGGWCSAAVGAYRGQRNGGGARGAIVGGVTAYFSYQAGAGGDAAVIGFTAAASGCANAWAAGGSCGRGAVSGLANQYAGPIVGGCISARVSGGSCQQGARDGFAGYLGSTVGSWAGQTAYDNVVRSRVIGETRGDGRSVQVASRDKSSGLEYLFNALQHMAGEKPTSPITTGDPYIDSTLGKLNDLALQALSTSGDGKGPVFGTKVHFEFSTLVNGLGRTDLFTEQSFDFGGLVAYGTDGSIRTDVILGKDPTKPVAIFDLKTGSARLTQARADQIRARFPGFTGPIIGIYPQVCAKPPC